MAINKNLPVGAILFLHHTPYYSEANHRRLKEPYQIRFHALYVYNRRERTAGANVPRSFIPSLTKLGIRFEDNGYETVTAVGCRNWTYYTANSHFPYPSIEDMDNASAEFRTRLQAAASATSENGTPLTESEFIPGFVDKKMTNKDLLFTLQPSLHKYVANETYIK